MSELADRLEGIAAEYGLARGEDPECDSDADALCRAAAALRAMEWTSRELHGARTILQIIADGNAGDPAKYSKWWLDSAERDPPTTEVL